MVFQSRRWSLKQIATNTVTHIDPCDNCLVGRKLDAKISLRTSKASRSHGTIMINGEGNLMVMDLKSINGTFVNGHTIPVYVSHRVYSGDRISFGIADEVSCENEFDREVFFEVVETDLSLDNIVTTIDLVEDEPEISGLDSLQKNVTKEQELDKSLQAAGTSSSSSSTNIKDTTNNNREHSNSNSSDENSTSKNGQQENCESSSVHKLNRLLGDLNAFFANGDTSKEKVTKSKTSSSNTSSGLSKDEIEIAQDPKNSEMSKHESITGNSNSRRSFTTRLDNSIVIELSDEEDVDFSASQIFQTTQIKKEGENENGDEVFQKIKTELAEMDFCSQEIICNQIPIDVEDGEGFENTQQIFAVLQDDNEQSSAGASGSKAKTKPENVNVEVIKPYTESRRSPRARKKEIPDKLLDDDDDDKITKKSESSATTKRKLSIDKTPVEKKKSKPSHKTPPTFKDMKIEIKRRHSTSKDLPLNKEDVEIIKEERRKKLKELASPTHDSGTKATVTEGTETTSEHSAPNANEVLESGTDPLLALNVKKRTSLLSSHEKSTVATRTMKVIQSPPAQAPSRYNLRRAKSSDEIKIAKKRKEANEEPTRASRHSTHIIPNPEPISRPRADPRREPQTNNGSIYKQPITQFLNPQPHHSTNVFARPQKIWSDNIGAFKKRQPRRVSNADDIIQIMITWLPNWLSEQCELDVSPPINTPAAKRVPKKFKDFDQYYNAFTKLILLETWQYVYNSWAQGSADLNRVQRKVCIDHVRIVNNQMNIDCAYYITKEEAKRNDYCKPDDFVTFECVTYDQANISYMQLSFGVVLCSRKKILREDNLISVKPNICAGEVHSKIEFTVATRHYPDRELNRKKWPMMTIITNVKSFMMHVRALKELKQSPLCSMITEPKMNDFKFTNSYGDVKQRLDLNNQQKTIVLEAVNLCTGNRPGIYCVKGPPGTGKSTVIVNIILEILFSHYQNPSTKPPMILLSAPSNAAVDNLIMKIVKAKQVMETELKRNVKLVRIGPESSISRSVIGYSLANLTEKHLPLKNQHIPVIKAAADNNTRVLETIKDYFKDQYSQEFKACENLVIKKSNIICTTLNSCINSRLIDCVNKGIIEFSCCIIDEATQCHEPESLLPTMLGIDKFVLVGDPQQLNATVMSNDAIKLGFQNSLFSRLANNFGTDPRSPIRLLTDQYRMHPEICFFPNKTFYNSQLRSFPNPPNRLPAELRPYLVFNCEKISHSSNDYTNIDEVILIKTLISTIFSVVDKNIPFSIGVITPYNAQKDLLLTNISDLMRERETCKILVNTVDSFQGSENDIIIISCVRHYSNSFLKNVHRLNVALTRAKQALYIIGNYALFKECKPLYDLREDAKRRKVLLDIRQDPRTIMNFQKYLLQSPRISTGADGTSR